MPTGVYPRIKKVKSLFCKTCGNKFVVAIWDSKRRKYCSKKCFYISHSKNMSGKNHPLYGVHPSRNTLIKMSKSLKKFFKKFLESPYVLVSVILLFLLFVALFMRLRKSRA